MNIKTAKGYRLLKLHDVTVPSFKIVMSSLCDFYVSTLLWEKEHFKKLYLKFVYLYIKALRKFLLRHLKIC